MLRASGLMAAKQDLVNSAATARAKAAPTRKPKSASDSPKGPIRKSRRISGGRPEVAAAEMVAGAVSSEVRASDPTVLRLALRPPSPRVESADVKHVRLS